ncbi:MAG: BamA/TamA family outer membrane protein [Myxococcales bacterium]|jgi:hypothetical protein|nr:BamA/TamA family outer membrane protein [Myxococcales bacterium]
MRTLAATLALLGLMAMGGPARADEPPPAPEHTIDTGAMAERGEFGPAITLEHIEIVGNHTTSRQVILRVLPFAIGDRMAAGDPRLRKARFKVLSLGFFRDVTMSMRRGSAHGQVVIIIGVEERGTVVLNRLWFGSSSIAPWWVGADLSERNLLGTGLSIGGGLVYASHDEVLGSRDQWAGEARLGIPSLCGGPWSLAFALAAVRGSEAYRKSGASSQSDAEHYLAFPYRRTTARASASYDITALARVSFGGRGELIDAELPVAPTRVLPDGRSVPVALHLEPGRSQVLSGFASYDRDSRADPLLPHSGSRLTIAAEVSGVFLGSSYDFASLVARYERWWPLRLPRHALGVRVSGGLILGDAPRFDWIHIADVNRMLAPRAQGLLVSTNAPLQALGTAPEKATEGELGGAASVEYVYRLFDRKHSRIYAGDLFVGAGLWGLADSAGVRTRDRALWDSLPIDLFLDAGLRIDTDIGVFELTVANTLGRVPR